ncbi:MAG TPA: response regulator, partial [Gaiellaceae bacterium]|nr:response regulator [Gaiellaceae bacterium]
TIWVASEEGEGSIFHVELVAEEAEVPARTSEHERPQLEGKRLLVVDDNATSREIVIRHARSWGMETVAVAEPRGALALITAGEPFDVAVLDLVLPDMDGLALAREIRRHRDGRELPLLLVTSIGRRHSARAAAGEFAAQLAKPLKASQLYDVLVTVLADRAKEPEVAVAASDGATPAASPLRILLAEDNRVNQKVALALLDRLGYEADVAWNGLEVLEALERQPYDVVLMDVEMPELDGLDASRRICERWPPDVRPRLIAMTANAMPEHREACLAAGMDDYVPKPIRPDVLAEAMRRVRPHEEVVDASSTARLEP